MQSRIIESAGYGMQTTYSMRLKTRGTACRRHSACITTHASSKARGIMHYGTYAAGQIAVALFVAYCTQAAIASRKHT